MHWSTARPSGLKEEAIWLEKEHASSSAMIARMSGRNHTEPQDQSNARNAPAQTSTEPHKTEDTPEEAEEQAEAGNMDRTRIAIPCVGQANLDAPVSPHFGRCDSYAIVTLEEGKVKTVESLSNANHSDCTSPVRTLAESGVRLMLVTGMGMRPYLALKQLGIEVRYGVNGTVLDAVESYLRNETLPMEEDRLCGCNSES